MVMTWMIWGTPMTLETTIYIYTYIHHIAKIPMQRTSARPHALAAGTSHPTPQGRHWLRKKPAHIHQKPMLDMSQS